MKSKKIKNLLKSSYEFQKMAIGERFFEIMASIAVIFTKRKLICSVFKNSMNLIKISNLKGSRNLTAS